MSIWWYLATVVASAGIIFALLTSINLIRGMLKYKERAIIINLPLFLSYMVTALGFCALLILNESFRIPWLLMMIFWLFSVFCLCVPITPQGVMYVFPFGYKLVSNEEYSYEYSETKFGECVKLYRKGIEKPAVFHIGIHKSTTVKMLADWYGKHGFENPLTK